ncbi:glyoxalase [Rhizobium sp. Root708]|uniref:VOC family protein n=1 Tax=Rhizobium sp. Root708 TaxID=1736592 RepID=UPI0006F5C36C|nr:VOC family protein [Rhizobium sp. Root708]KRB62628.1 glyoxalase [Rhizobium sp. Root708]
MEIDHVTLRTADLEGTRTFLEALLGLEPGFRPDFPFPGYWLYRDRDPIVHLIPGGGSPVDRAAETIDHVAFRLDGYDAFRARLDTASIAYSTMDLPELGERRLFVRTPGGILIELVFRTAIV